jgi:hypothetical protein
MEWQLLAGTYRSPFFPWPWALAPQLSRTLRNGRICQSMAVFWGGTRFCQQMSSEILRIGSVELTHRSGSYEKRPHVLAVICGQQVRPLVTVHGNIGFLCLVRYAIPLCATLDPLCEILTLC